MKLACFVMLSALFVLWYFPVYASSNDDNDDDDSRSIPEDDAERLGLKLSIDIEFCYNTTQNPNQINSFIKNSLIHCF
jgi:hypothetical protein